MTRRIWVLLPLTAAILLLSGGALRELPAYASADSVTEPRMFAEGAISSPFDEFGAAFADAGRTVFFNRSVPRSNLYVIYQSRFQHGRWGTPEVAPFSGRYWDFDAVISPDGSKMVFGSDRPIPGQEKKDKDFDIWITERTRTGWSEPRNLGPQINSGEDETFASLAANGTLYFTSGRDGGRAHLAIYSSRFIDGKYQPAEKLAGPVNDPENWSLEVLVAPDESYLLLVPYNRPGGFGSFDIYVSRQHAGAWSAPENLGPKINTRSRDYSPRFSPDGKYLFWSSERGLATEPPKEPLAYPELKQRLHGTLNGWGNIYQIELSALELEWKR
jgi:Tol biopolymer transport system component